MIPPIFIALHGRSCHYIKVHALHVELANCLDEKTDAGPNYLLRVHFADRVRSISVSDLKQFQLRNKTAQAPDPMLLYDFFCRFEAR